MKIFDYFECDDTSCWKEQIRACDWSAAVFLAKILDEDKFEEILGEGGRLFIMADDDKLAAFATLTPKDCIADDSLFPWIGFVFTHPDYRGHRFSGEVIEYACKAAGEHGHSCVYLATDHIGLYEKYGFEYIETRTDIYNEQSRIYRKVLF